MAYWSAILKFLVSCYSRGNKLGVIESIHIAHYIELHPSAPSAVKQHLAALRIIFDWLVVGQVISLNPVTCVKGPKLLVTEGKTPILSADEAWDLFNSIDVSNIVGL